MAKATVVPRTHAVSLINGIASMIDINDCALTLDTFIQAACMTLIYSHRTSYMLIIDHRSGELLSRVLLL